MTDRLDRALRRWRWPPLPQIPQGPGVRYVLALLRPRATAPAGGQVAAAVGPRREESLLRVVQFRACGGPEVLQWGDASDPRAGPGRIRVVVRAAGVNPVEWKTFAGTMSDGRCGNLREADRG